MGTLVTERMEAYYLFRRFDKQADSADGVRRRPLIVLSAETTLRTRKSASYEPVGMSVRTALK
jgi:hypothetical protein